MKEQEIKELVEEMSKNGYGIGEYNILFEKARKTLMLIFSEGE